jgi:hypothetical protein
MEEPRAPRPNEPPDDKPWKLSLNLEIVSPQRARPWAWIKITVSITALLVLLGLLLGEISFRELLELAL